MGIPLLIHQPSYSMLNRWIEDGLLDALQEVGAGAITFSPLAQGLLTNRYLDGVPAGSRAAEDKSLSPDMLSDENLDRIRGLAAIAEARGQSLAQMAVAWTLRDPRVTTTLLGASSAAQLEETVRAVERLDFTDAELERSTSSPSTATSTCGPPSRRSREPPGAGRRRSARDRAARDRLQFGRGGRFVSSSPSPTPTPTPSSVVWADEVCAARDNLTAAVSALGRNLSYDVTSDRSALEQIDRQLRVQVLSVADAANRVGTTLTGVPVDFVAANDLVVTVTKAKDDTTEAVDASHRQPRRDDVCGQHRDRGRRGGQGAGGGQGRLRGRTGAGDDRHGRDVHRDR